MILITTLLAPISAALPRVTQAGAHTHMYMYIYIHIGILYSPNLRVTLIIRRAQPIGFSVLVLALRLDTVTEGNAWKDVLDR